MSQSRQPLWRPLSRYSWLACMLALLGVLSLHQPALTQDKKAEPLGTTYIGFLKGGAAPGRVGIVVEKDAVTAYVCGLDEAFNQASARWFTGKLSAAGELQASSSDGQQLKGKLTGKTLAVSIKAGEKELTSDAELVPLDSPAGIYRLEDKVEGDDLLIGWILDAEGKVVGAGQLQKSKKVQAAPANINAVKANVSPAKVGVGQVNAKVNITDVKIGQINAGGAGLGFDILWDASTGQLAAAKITGFTVDFTATFKEPGFTPLVKQFQVAPTARNKFVSTSDVGTITNFTTKVTMQFEFAGQKAATSSTKSGKFAN